MDAVVEDTVVVGCTVVVKASVVEACTKTAYTDSLI